MGPEKKEPDSEFKHYTEDIKESRILLALSMGAAGMFIILATRNLMGAAFMGGVSGALYSGYQYLKSRNL